MKILLFAGTGDGHDLALWLAEKGIPFTVSVATEYGETLLPEGMDVHVGRYDGSRSCPAHHPERHRYSHRRYCRQRKQQRDFRDEYRSRR